MLREDAAAVPGPAAPKPAAQPPPSHQLSQQQLARALQQAGAMREEGPAASKPGCVPPMIGAFISPTSPSIDG